MDDIAPDLLKKLQEYFAKSQKDNAEIASLLELLENGTATYAEAGRYACGVGEALAKSFQACLSGDVLPDGKMYWNIAKNTVEPLLREDYDKISQYAVQTQEALNQAAGIGIKAQKAPLDEDRVSGILNKICAAGQYDDVAWMLNAPVVIFSQAIVDETLRRNVEFQGKTGLRPKIIRRAEHGCCKWCSKLSGQYDYPDVPEDIYRRHQNCRCIVEYDPGSGKRQNVWTKEWTDPGENDKIEERKQIGAGVLTDADKVALNQYKSFESYLLNEALRENIALTEAQQEMMRRLDRALEKLPTYEGTTYRSLDESRIKDIDAFWERYQVGKRVEESAYVSTSTSVYDDNFGIQMIISGRSGRDLEVYTSFENEILYPRNVEFFVTKREGNTIWLEES